MFGVIEKENVEVKRVGEREYCFANTPLGRIAYFQFGKLTQWKNITNGDLLWTIKPTEQFEDIHSEKPVETFASKRLSGFASEKIIISGEEKYWLAERKITDGYLYEIPAGLLRNFPKKSFPGLKFPYTRYKINAIANLNYSNLENLKTEETIRINEGLKHSISDVSLICYEVYRYCKAKRY